MTRTVLILALVAAIAAGPANAGPVAAGVALIQGAMASSVVVAFVVRAGLTLALSALANALNKPEVPETRRAGIKTSVTQTGGTNGQRLILGRYATAGTLVAPPSSWPNSGEIPNRILDYVVSIADVPGVTLNRLIVNGEYVSLEAQSEIPEHDLGGWYQEDAVEDDDDYHVYLTYHDGSQVAADAYMMAYHGSDATRPWASDMIGEGLSYAVASFRWHDKIYSGLPAVKFEVDGMPLYDPRLDTTVGGSGAHRWNDSATWEQTDNPAVMIYNLLRGITLPGGEVYGGEAEAEDLPPAVWFEAMNECDTAISLKGGGTEPQYRAGIEIDVTADEPAAVIEELLAACSAEICEAGGVWYIRVGAPGLPVFSLTDDGIIADDPEVLLPYEGLDSTFNGISATFPNPDSLWEQSEPVIRTNATWEAEDDGRRLMAEIALNAVPYERQVQRLSKAWIADARRFRQHQMTLPPEAAVLSPLDTLAWTSTRNGYTTKVFEIASLVDDLVTCQQAIGIRERDQSDFNWVPATDEADIITVDPTVPNAVARSVPGWDVQPASIIDHDGVLRRPAIAMLWTASDVDDATALRFQVRPVGQTDLVAQGTTADLSAGQLVVGDGIVPSGQYEARGRLVIPGRATTWTAWDQATAPLIKFSTEDLDAEINAAIAAVADVQADLLVAESQINSAKANILAAGRGWINRADGFNPQQAGAWVDPGLVLNQFGSPSVWERGGTGINATAPSELFLVFPDSMTVIDFPTLVMPPFRVEGDQTFFISFDAALGFGGTTASVAVGLIFYDKNGVEISSVDCRTDLTTPGAWGSYYAERTPPSNAVTASAMLRVRNATSQDGNLAVAKIRVGEKGDGGTFINDESIGTPLLEALAVTAEKIAAGAIIAEKIGANAVTAAKIQALAVTAEKIAASAVTAEKIAALSITAEKIAANAVTAAKIAASTITADKIVAKTIIADNIGDNELDDRVSALDSTTYHLGSTRSISLSCTKWVDGPMFLHLQFEYRSNSSGNSGQILVDWHKNSVLQDSSDSVPVVGNFNWRRANSSILMTGTTGNDFTLGVDILFSGSTNTLVDIKNMRLTILQPEK